MTERLLHQGVLHNPASLELSFTLHQAALSQQAPSHSGIIQ